MKRLTPITEKQIDALIYIKEDVFNECRTMYEMQLCACDATHSDLKMVEKYNKKAHECYVNIIYRIQDYENIFCGLIDELNYDDYGFNID